MFGLIIPGRPCLTDLTTISPTQSAFTFPVEPHFSHIVVFILPGNVLPPGSAAAVYMQLPTPTDPTTTTAQSGAYRFLGAIANEKPSAIFKVNLGQARHPLGTTNTNTNTDGSDMMTDDGSSQQPQPQPSGISGSTISLGISIEPIPNIQAQLQQLQQQQQQNSSLPTSQSTALTRTTNQNTTSSSNPHRPSTKILAQRIIQNAFNFLASFAGGGNAANGGQEFVPLKSFEDWWRKFERRVEMDPGFLERDAD